MATKNNRPAIPWELVDLRALQSDGPGCKIWKSPINYQDHSNPLQTLYLWIPRRQEEILPHDVIVDPGSVTERKFWIVFIHGGAWRDPDVTALSFEPTIRHLLQTATPGSKTDPLDRIAGFASIDYSLSPYPTHSTDPSPPQDGRCPQPNRTAKHPQHIRDILKALSWLQLKFALNQDYILCGHSCGATLAFQTLIEGALKEAQDETTNFVRPMAIVGINGLYDLPRLVDGPGKHHEHLAPIYESFIKGAFGPADDEVRSAWKAVSPARQGPLDWETQWPEGKLAFLAQSQDDSLVPGSQTSSMAKSLEDGSRERLRIMESNALTGDHDHVWEDGKEFALILAQALNYLAEVSED